MSGKGQNDWGAFDPVRERLKHAKERLSKEVEANGALSGEDLATVYDDVLLVWDTYNMNSSQRHAVIDQRLDHLQETKVDKNPRAAKAFWILLPVLATFALGVAFYLFTGGSNG
jgi:hypothetical protein